MRVSDQYYGDEEFEEKEYNSIYPKNDISYKENLKPTNLNELQKSFAPADIKIRDGYISVCSPGTGSVYKYNNQLKRYEKIS